MELYLHANGNVISMNSLKTIVANAMETSKLVEASFYEYDLFSSPALEDSYSIADDDTKPPIYDDYNDEYDIFSPPIFDDYGDENNSDSYFVEFAPTMINKNDYAYVESNNYFMHVDHDKNFCVIVILLILFMLLLKVIMREGNMVLCISIILSFPSL